MPRKRNPLPTNAELLILRVLWDREPCTVREVWKELGRGRELAYTTVLRQLQIMTEKGLVKRDTKQRSHTYTAKIKEEPTQRKLVASLAKVAFGGSTRKLVMKAISDHEASPEEIAEIRRLLNEKEKES